MDRHVNLSAYEDFEKLENLNNKIDEYRQSKLNSAKTYVNFIKNQFPDKQIIALELGSGNSRTLFALEKAGVLKKGYGIEVSKSRFEFAELWKKEWNFKRVENINANVIDINFEDYEDFDLCFCTDVAFQLFEPVKKGKAFEILQNVNKKLCMGGKIILELDDFERILSKMKMNKVKLWEEFSPPDPWRWSLWDCKYDSENRILKWKKVFIKRDEFGSSESYTAIRVYKKDEVYSLLKDANFKKIEVFSDLGDESCRNLASEYIIAGTK